MPKSQPTQASLAIDVTSLTVAQAAAALGFSAETVRKHGEELGAYRLGRRGPWRIPRARVDFFRANPKLISQPKASLQELFQTVQRINLLSAERERRCEAALTRMEARLARCEAALAKSDPTAMAA